jgi:hypothetical protein
MKRRRLKRTLSIIGAVFGWLILEMIWFGGGRMFVAEVFYSTNSVEAASIATGVIGALIFLLLPVSIIAIVRKTKDPAKNSPSPIL